MATASYAGTNYALRAAPLVGTWPNAAASNDQLYCMADEVYFGAACDLGSLFYVGKLPVGAVVQFSVVWPTTAATYGAPTTLSNTTTFQMGNSTDPDLFGDITAMNASALPQVIEPVPDGTIYTTTLDFALREETDVVLTSAADNGTATEGLVVKILYTMAGRTY
jgi:hypothetical protein